MKGQQSIRSMLITLLIVALAVKVLEWVITPFIPLIISGLVILGAFALIYHRTTKL